MACFVCDRLATKEGKAAESLEEKAKVTSAGGCGLEINSTDLIVRWRWFVVWRRCFSGNSERINVGMARARNQRHHHYRERWNKNDRLFHGRHCR